MKLGWQNYIDDGDVAGKCLYDVRKWNGRVKLTTSLSRVCVLIVSLHYHAILNLSQIYEHVYS